MLKNPLVGGLLATSFLIATSLSSLAIAAEPSTPAQTPEWVERSNAIAYKILESGAKFAPEFAGQTGVDGYDEEIFDFLPNREQRVMAVSQDNIEMLTALLETEKDSRVRQDIEIMIQSEKDDIESTRINLERVLPYGSISRLIFAGFNGLLDKQVPLERQQAALVRLKKYTGQAEGYRPIAELARERISARFDKGLIRPFIGEVEQDLERASTFIEGLDEVFAATELTGYEEDLDLLQQQLTEHVEWVRAEFLPRTRESAVLPRELYELNLKRWGVDLSPEALIEIGRVAFMNIRNEMIALAPLVAAEKGYDATDYRDVINLLKKEQVQGDALLAAYQEVMASLDEIIVENNLLSLPDEPARVRMATAAETAQSPAAHLDVPRLVGNTGEFPEFIVPLIEQNEDGSWPDSDYAFRAQMWTLSAHEARPGHEMQFTTMLRGGVSTARALFAFNSANVEGWALYAEAIAKPYMPLDGQLLSLQGRLLRAQRIWMDPMLNLGLVTREDARRILMEEVMEDEVNTKSELDRYIFRIPGQATAYYYGYTKLLGLRADAELRLKDKFSDQAFHDFILAQGLLPPQILRQAVMEDFVAPQLQAGGKDGKVSR
jgi:hypothetical protein